MSNQTSRPVVRLGVGGGGNLTGEAATKTRPTVQRLLRYLGPYTRQLLVVAALVVVSTLLKLAGPVLLGRALDRYIVPGQMDGFTRLCLVMLVVYLVAAAATFVHNWIMVGIGQNLVTDVRGELFDHVQTLSMPYHDQHRSGDLMSRISNDTEAINQALSNGLIEFTSNILLLGGTLITMFLLNWQLALGALVVIPAMLWITGEVTKRSRKAFRQVQRNLGALNAEMEESIAGIQTIQAFAREADTFAQFREVNAQNRQSGIRADIITAALGPMFTTMSTITIAVTALLGGWLSLRGVVSVGVIAVFVIYIMNFFRPMRGIAMLYNQLQSALAGAERIFEVLDDQPSVADVAYAQHRPIEGHVRFDDVSFGYAPGKPVLEHVTLEAHPGQTIALVGPTGAGKTTIISLLSRFYDVDEGTITIDGADIRTLPQESIRRQLGIVLQDTFLFSGTVMENIRYGRLDARDDEVYAAARMANADHFIRTLPDG
ncbi:MAG: ABC transporter ATP-binding protein, partial [Caldilineaceae bacterium]|nr:ABC transporter ATP-binding protein [Caldilineaceae bacterium]